MKENGKLPEGWNLKKLGEVVQVLDGLRRPINSTERKKRAEGKSTKELFPYYGATGQVGWMDSYLTNGEYILVGEDGAPFLDNSKKKAYKISGKTWVNNHAHILKEIEGRTINAFILHFLNSINYRQYVNGTTRLKLTKGSLVEIPIPLPKVPTQQAVASKIDELFSELDKGIENLHIAQEQLKTYRQAVLKWAFEGRLTNENVKEGELPEGWVLKKLNELGDWKGGGTPSKSNKTFWEKGNILWVSPKDMKSKYISDTIDKITPTAINNSSTKLVSKDSVLFVVRSGILRRTLPVALTTCDVTLNQDMQAFTPRKVLAEYVYWYIKAKNEDIRRECSKDGTTVESIESTLLKNYFLPVATFAEQRNIVQAIESCLSMADKSEESISQSLQQAEALRQSILKKAFEGKLLNGMLVTNQMPKNTYFYQMQVLGLIAQASKKHEIVHGEMTLAKYAYLVDKIYKVPTYFVYNKWHLGPYSPGIKKIVRNRTYFTRVAGSINVINDSKLFKYRNPYANQIVEAIDELADIFSKYPFNERAHKTELLATLCKVIEDSQTLDLKRIRSLMKDWKVDLQTTSIRNKAEKFSEEETKNCLSFIQAKGWDKKLLN